MIKNEYNHNRLKYFTLINQVDTNNSIVKSILEDWGIDGEKINDPLDGFQTSGCILSTKVLIRRPVYCFVIFFRVLNGFHDYWKWCLVRIIYRVCTFFEPVFRNKKRDRNFGGFPILSIHIRAQYEKTIEEVSGGRYWRQKSATEVPHS